MHISFLKKKKKKVGWICGNGIAKIGGKKKIPSYFGSHNIRLRCNFRLLESFILESHFKTLKIFLVILEILGIAEVAQ